MDDTIHKAADVILGADIVVFATGAGMGVDSDLLSFREKEVFWKSYPTLRRLGIDFPTLYRPKTFQEDPHLAWAFYGHRFNLCQKTVPQEGYRVQRRIADFVDYVVHTTNTDGAYLKAGFSPDKVVEVNGNINYLQRIDAESPVWRTKDEHIKVDLEVFRTEDPLPRCAQTGHIARPNLRMFEDWAFSPSRYNQQRDKMGKWLGRQHDHQVVVIECGAGKLIPGSRIFSERFVTAEWGQLVRIHPQESEGPGVSIPLGAAEAMLMIEEALEQRGFFEKAR